MASDIDEDTQRFPRHKPEASSEKAEAILFDLLDQAGMEYNQGGKSQRYAMMLALEAVKGFLGIRGFSGQHIRPLIALSEELDFLYQGNRSLVLQPGVESREDLTARHTGPGKQEIRMYAAACSEALYQLGKDEAASIFGKLTRVGADEKIARVMQKWPAFDQTHKVTDRTIKGWRDRLEANKWGELDTARWQSLIDKFIRDDIGQKQLKQVIKEGPPMTGGFR